MPTVGAPPLRQLGEVVNRLYLNSTEPDAPDQAMNASAARVAYAVFLALAERDAAGLEALERAVLAKVYPLEDRWPAMRPAPRATPKRKQLDRHLAVREILNHAEGWRKAAGAYTSREQLDIVSNYLLEQIARYFNVTTFAEDSQHKPTVRAVHDALKKHGAVMSLDPEKLLCDALVALEFKRTTAWGWIKGARLS